MYDPNPLSRDDHIFGMLCHLPAFSTFIIPFGSIIGPLLPIGGDGLISI